MSGLPINFLTLNLGEIKPEQWDGMLSTGEWSSFLNPNPKECWVICSQEDTEESQFMTALQSQLEHGGRWIHSSLPKAIMADRFYVHIGMFIPTQYTALFPDPSYHYVIKHDRKKMSRILSIGPFVFVGSHLPFFKFIQRWSYGRERAMKEVMEYIATEPKLAGKTVVMLGDLNFRFIDGKDQLIGFIDKPMFGYDIQDVSWNNGITAPTCKMNVTRSPNCHIGRTLVGTPSLQAQPKCYNASREPSLCDRVLVMTPLKDQKMKVSSHVKHVAFPPITQSDHNAIHARIEFGTFGGKGGRRKSIKHPSTGNF